MQNDRAKESADGHTLRPRLVSAREAAELLGLSERYLRGLKAAGKLRAVKFGKRRVMLPLTEVDRLARDGVK